MGMDIRDKVDETIVEICNWIQKDLKNDSHLGDKSYSAEMVKALAELVSARDC